MALVKTPRAIIDILDSEGKITGHEIEYNMAWEGEGAEMFTSGSKRIVATFEEVAAIRGTADESLTEAHKKLNEQLATERAAFVAEQAELQERYDKLRETAIKHATQLGAIVKILES